ncbi:MAG TPA: DUF92 domain-containing protein [Gemmatimonadaceae bacterium]|nr:DUF92 domain-containing protein [Gemmatimonadaceae bacterium]
MTLPPSLSQTPGRVDDHRPSQATALIRAAAGLALAAAIAGGARRARSLSSGGAVAATAAGTVAMAAGWSWGALLIGYFVASTLLTRAGAAAKAARTMGMAAKGGERDAMQVLANGGPFVAAAAGAVVAPHPLWNALALGALATSAADTWATEVGTLAGQPPRSIVTGRPVPVGASGGVSAAGSLAAVAGAGFVVLLAGLMRWPWTVVAAGLAGGVAGAFLDSLLGATVQARRRCSDCDTTTERIVHGCGTVTTRAGGWPWLDNDGVNLASGVGGALLAAAIAAALLP